MTRSPKPMDPRTRAANAWRLIRLVTVGLVASVLLTEASDRQTREDEAKDRQLGALLLIVSLLDAVVWIVVDRRAPDEPLPEEPA